MTEIHSQPPHEPDGHEGHHEGHHEAHFHGEHHHRDDHEELSEKLRGDAWHPGHQLPVDKHDISLPTYHFPSNGLTGDTQRTGQDQKDFAALKELLTTSGGLPQPPAGTPTLGYGYTVQRDNSGNLYVKQATDLAPIPGQPVTQGTLITGAARTELLDLINKAGGLKDLNTTGSNGERASIDVYVASDGQIGLSRAVGNANPNRVGEKISTVQVSADGRGTETVSGFGPKGTFPTRSYPVELGDGHGGSHEHEVSPRSVDELQSIASSRPSTIPVVLTSSGRGGYVVDGVDSTSSTGDVNYPPITISGHQASELKQILKAVDPNGANNQYIISTIPNSQDIRVQTNTPLVEGRSQLITAIVTPSGKITVTESAPTIIPPPVPDPGPPAIAPGTAVGDGNYVPGQSRSSSSPSLGFDIAGTGAGAIAIGAVTIPFEEDK